MIKGNYTVSLAIDCTRAYYFSFFGRTKHEAGVEHETHAIGVSRSSLASRLPSLAWTTRKTCSAGFFRKDLVEICAPTQSEWRVLRSVHKTEFQEFLPSPGPGSPLIFSRCRWLKKELLVKSTKFSLKNHFSGMTISHFGSSGILIPLNSETFLKGI